MNSREAEDQLHAKDLVIQELRGKLLTETDTRQEPNPNGTTVQRMLWWKMRADALHDQLFSSENARMVAEEIQHAEKKILIAEVEAHTKTKLLYKIAKDAIGIVVRNINACAVSTPWVSHFLGEIIDKLIQQDPDAASAVIVKEMQTEVMSTRLNNDMLQQENHMIRQALLQCVVPLDVKADLKKRGYTV